MQALEFWQLITVDKANLLQRLIATLHESGIRFCVIGGVAVNAYVEPVVTLDLDLVVAVDQIEEAEQILARSFDVKRFAHSINVTLPDSKLRIQIQTDSQFSTFVERASTRDVLGLDLPVADIQDLVRSKVWAAQDSTRRPSKRQKDYADIARLIEAYPELASLVPGEIRSRLV